MKNRATAFLAVAALVCMIPTMGLALSPYNTDFEDYSLPAPAAQLGDGWLIYGNVFGLDWSYWYGYGAVAPNDGAAFCAIVTGEGGSAQGQLQLSVYSDYNHPDQAIINLESNVFQEQIIGPGDLGEEWTFHFDAKMGNLVNPPTTAVAFIKILNPADWSVIFIPLDMTTIPTTWGTYVMPVTIDPTWDGRILQFGFANTTTNYNPSGVLYDNVRFYPSQPIATEEMSYGSVKSLYR